MVQRPPLPERPTPEQRAAEPAHRSWTAWISAPWERRHPPRASRRAAASPWSRAAAEAPPEALLEASRETALWSARCSNSPRGRTGARQRTGWAISCERSHVRRPARPRAAGAPSAETRAPGNRSSENGAILPNIHRKSSAVHVRTISHFSASFSKRGRPCGANAQPTSASNNSAIPWARVATVSSTGRRPAISRRSRISSC